MKKSTSKWKADAVAEALTQRELTVRGLCDALDLYLGQPNIERSIEYRSTIYSHNGLVGHTTPDQSEVRSYPDGSCLEFFNGQLREVTLRRRAFEHVQEVFRAADLLSICWTFNVRSR